MQSFITKYGLAAHLAILAVAPLLLYPFSPETVAPGVLLWLSAVAAIWAVFEPARLPGEHLYQARPRVMREIVRDPVFWLLVVLVVVAAIRWANTGVGMAYDLETQSWSLSGPWADFLPGCSGDSGRLPFAGAVAALVLLTACRHALDYWTAVGVLMVAGFLAGVFGIVLAAFLLSGSPWAVALANGSYVHPVFIGTAFGFHLIGTLMALGGAARMRCRQFFPVFILAIGGTATGLVLFAPPTVAAVFAAGAFVAILLTLPCGAWCMLSIVVGLALPAALLYCEPSLVPDWKSTLPGEDVLSVRAAISDVAMKAWGQKPWFGWGEGSFASVLKFLTTESDWAVIPVKQSGPMNGWWLLLVERGIFGALSLAVTVVFLGWTYVVRLVRAPLSADPMRWCFPLALAVCAAAAFFECSYLRVENLLAVGAMLAISAEAVKRTESDTDG